MPAIPFLLHRYGRYLLPALMLSACCRTETVKCLEPGLLLVFRGFDASAVQEIRVSYLVRGGQGRVVTDSFLIDPDQISDDGAGNYQAAVLVPDSLDAEVSLPLATRTWTITGLQRQNRPYDQIRVCGAAKVDIACTNSYTSGSVNGVPVQMDPGDGRLLLAK